MDCKASVMAGASGTPAKFDWVPGLTIDHLQLTISAASDGRLHIPDEGAEAELVGVFVEVAQGFQQAGDDGVVDDGQDGFVHGRPRVRTEMRVARAGAAAGDLTEGGVAAAVEVGEQREDVFVMRLIAGYKYGFHKMGKMK